MRTESESGVSKKAKTDGHNEAGKVCQGLVCMPDVNARSKHNPVNKRIDDADRSILSKEL